MVDRFETQRARTEAPSRARETAVDEGLRSYMLGIYNYMTGGVLLTGIVAMLVYRVPFLTELFYSVQQTAQGPQLSPNLLGWLAMIAPLGFVLVLSFGIQKLKASTAQTLFWVFAGVMGLSISHIFFTFTGASIARTFFVTAAAFGALSLYGYTTKRDLSALGKFLFMGLIGLLIAIVVNLFLQSTMLQFIVSCGGVLIFAGLTAYDTQRLKNMYYQVAGSSEMLAKASVMGALSLYLDFINMFMFLLQLMGARE